MEYLKQANRFCVSLVRVCPKRDKSLKLTPESTFEAHTAGKSTAISHEIRNHRVKSQNSSKHPRIFG